MKHLFTLLSLFVVAVSAQANELVVKYDEAVKSLNAQVAEAYDNTNLYMSSADMLHQLNEIQGVFDAYVEVASEIKARFKQKDLQLYADLSEANPKYCKLEAERNSTLTYLALVDPNLSSLALLDEGEVVFKLKNYGDLMDFNRQLSREEYRIKMEKGKPKRYIRKLRLLQEELQF